MSLYPVNKCAQFCGGRRPSLSSATIIPSKPFECQETLAVLFESQDTVFFCLVIIHMMSQLKFCHFNLLWVSREIRGILEFLIVYYFMISLLKDWSICWYIFEKIMKTLVFGLNYLQREPQDKMDTPRQPSNFYSCLLLCQVCTSHQRAPQTHACSFSTAEVPKEVCRKALHCHLCNK